MSEGTANEKKRHHYIPITYLEKFADDAGKIFAYRKDDVQKAIYIKPSEIAFERYYYSQPLQDGGRDNNTLEDYFSTIESTWNSLVTRLRSGSAAKSDLEALCIFMGLMRVRVPAARDMVEVSLAEQVRATARLLDRQGKLPPKPKGCENILDELSVSIDPHQSLHAMSDLARGFGIVVDQLEFEVLHNKTEVSFITSDNPIVYFDPTVPEATVSPYQLRPRGEVELLFPIDANTILRGRNGAAGLSHASLNDRKFAKRINRYVTRFEYRFVFSQDQTHKSLITKYAAVSPVLRTVEVATESGVALNHEWVFGVRPTKPKWNAP